MDSNIDGSTIKQGSSRKAASHIDFSLERLNAIANMENWHFWFLARTKWFKRLLKQQDVKPKGCALDLGCGTGKTSELILKRGMDVVGLDVRREGLIHCSKRIDHHRFLQGVSTELPFKQNSFDLIIMMDVLEHVDDLETLKELDRVIRDGGVIIANVPALNLLWSYRDEAAGHLRRYSKKSLGELVDRSNFNIEIIHYYHFVTFPLTFLSRLFGRKRRTLRDKEDNPPGWLNHFLKILLYLEYFVGYVVKFPIGSSLMFVLKKG